MAIAITSITPNAQNANGKIKDLTVTVVVTGTYSAGGTALTTAQKAQYGADGKIIWQDNDPANPNQAKYNTSTGNLQLFTNGTELGAVSGAGTYIMRVGTIGSQSSAPALS